MNIELLSFRQFYSCLGYEWDDNWSNNTTHFEFRDLLDSVDENIWDFPIEEIPYLLEKENDMKYALIRDKSGEYRLYEMEF